MFKRSIETNINSYLSGTDHKIFFIWGPRRSGKTTLLEKLSQRLKVPVFNFDYESDREMFVPRREVLISLAQAHPVLLIDEVQNHPEVTLPLKILHDDFKVKIIATGSSELRQKSGQQFYSLSGRFTDNFCLPFSITEIAANIETPAYDKLQSTKQLLQSLEIFGAYPEIYANPLLSESEKIKLLQSVFDTYVLKDVVNLYSLKSEKLAKDILTKIALQISSEVSVREIANSLAANVSTVSNYIEIFIKNYILIPLPSFKTNIRKAVSENRKLYFYDLGIRNILVKDFRDLHLRPDKGGVFENFIVSEIEKRRKNLQLNLTPYFYREYGGQEVDLVLEDYHKNYTCIELKHTPQDKVKDIFPLNHRFSAINSKNYFEQIEKYIV